ncbi:hypothetical protein Esti_006299 [Eimeria stiedai]
MNEGPQAPLGGGLRWRLLQALHPETARELQEAAAAAAADNEEYRLFPITSDTDGVDSSSSSASSSSSSSSSSSRSSTSSSSSSSSSSSNSSRSSGSSSSSSSSSKRSSAHTLAAHAEHLEFKEAPSTLPVGPWRFSSETAAAVLRDESVLQRLGLGSLSTEGASSLSTLLCCPHSSCSLSTYCTSAAAAASAAEAVETLEERPPDWGAPLDEPRVSSSSNPAALLFGGFCCCVSDALPGGHQLGASCALLYELLSASGRAPPTPPNPTEGGEAVTQEAAAALETVGELLPALGPLEVTRLICCVRRLVAADKQLYQKHVQLLQRQQQHQEQLNLRVPKPPQASPLPAGPPERFSSPEAAAEFFKTCGVSFKASPAASFLLEAPADTEGPQRGPRPAERDSAEANVAAELQQDLRELLRRGESETTSDAAPSETAAVTPGRCLPPAREGRPSATAATAAAKATAAAAEPPRVTLTGEGTQLLEYKEESEGLPWLHRLCWNIVGGPAAQEWLQKQQQQQQQQHVSGAPEFDGQLVPLCRNAAELMAAILGVLETASDTSAVASAAADPAAAAAATAAASDGLLQLLGPSRVADVGRIAARGQALIDAAARLQMSGEVQQQQQQHAGKMQRKGPILVGASVKFISSKSRKGGGGASNLSGAPRSLLGALSDAGYFKPPKPLRPPPSLLDAMSLMSPRRGLRGCLPEGAKVTDSQVAFEVFIPPPQPAAVNEESLIPISALPEWARHAFVGIETLNPRQSAVYPVAFLTGASFLVCAPTGAGKTNIALLALLQQLNEYRHLKDSKAAPGRKHSSAREAHYGECSSSGWSPPSPKHFKAVYIAPMKSLAAEITAKFQSALKPLGIRVQEATADVPLTRKDIEDVHLFVAVPEKLDILTRNVGSVSGEGEGSLLDAIRCLVLDEVHLLNEQRGPVLEALVARILRHSERTQRLTRLVGISATLPNWREVADFLLVSPANAFNFGAECRPVPLEQTFKGIKEKDPNKQKKVYEAVTYEAVMSAVRRGHQAMVFVMSRQGTVATAEALAAAAATEGTLSLFSAAVMNPNQQQQALLSLVRKGSKYKELRSLVERGFVVHHAGMLRSDRNLSERLFASGLARVLCCTSTLAWGINLPARCVIIKGTTLFSVKEGGGNKDMGILDVAQIFGRAGRPQFDTVGEAALITEYCKLTKYVRLMTASLPVESRLLEDLPNALNAEVALGTVSSLADAAEWLRYTFLFVRMRTHPEAYGVSRDALQDDPTLLKTRLGLIDSAAIKLNECRLLRYHKRAGRLDITDLGRMAARFYVDYETARVFATELSKDCVRDADILRILGKAKDFEGLRIREEERNELDKLRQSRACRIPFQGDPDSIPCKVATLLQAFLSSATLEASSLAADLNYVAVNAGRLSRALLTASLADTVGRTEEAEKVLEWAKAFERGFWPDACVLRHFCNPNCFSADPQKRRSQQHQQQYGRNVVVVRPQAVGKIERLGFSQERLFSLSLSELQSICGSKADGEDVSKALRRIPAVDAEVRVVPITRHILRFSLGVSFVEGFVWSDALHGNGEVYHVWLSERDTGVLLHQETLALKRNNVREKQSLSFALPLHDPTTQTQFVLSIISDRWIGVSLSLSFAASQLFTPDASAAAATRLLDIHPVPVTALQDKKFESLYPFAYFNPIQSQTFHVCYHTDYNVLLGAPTGSGKTIVAELTMLRLFRMQPKQKVVYIAPLKALAAERVADWRARLGGLLGLRVAQLTAENDTDEIDPRQADVFVCTPEKWDGLSRQWRTREFVVSVGLLIIDEIHLLGQERGPVLEAIVSRMRFVSSHAGRRVRLVGLSTALANAGDVAGWMGIGRVGLYSFSPAVRPVPCTVHIAGFAQKAFCPRMAAMNKPTFDAILTHAVTDSRSGALPVEAQGVYSVYSASGAPESPAAAAATAVDAPCRLRPVLVFVASRRQTRITAKELIALQHMHADGSSLFLCLQTELQKKEFFKAIAQAKDSTLRSVLLHGVAIHHAGLSPADRNIAAHLFSLGCVRVLVATATLAWGLNLPARLVVIKGTEFYDGKTKRYTDMPMIGRAGRPQFDTEAVAVVLCQESKKGFLKRFLYLPFPVESCLHLCLPEHLNAEIVAGTICSKSMAIDYLTWTYFFRRLAANPGYYSADLLAEDTRGGGAAAAERRRQMIASYLDRLVSTALDTLLELGCICLRLPEPAEGPAAAAAEKKNEGEEDVVAVGFRKILLEQQEKRQQQQEGVVEPIIEPTALGRIACLYYIAPETAKMLRDRMQPEASPLSFVDIVRLLSDVKEFAEMPLRHNEDIHNAELAHLCPFAVSGDTFDSPHTKTFLLLQARMFRRPLPVTDYATDLKSALDNSMRVIQAMIDVAAEEAQLRYALYIILLLQCLQSGTHPARSSLFCLPHMTDAAAAVLQQRGLYSLAHLLEHRSLASTLSAAGMGLKEREEAAAFLARIPRLRMRWFLFSRASPEESENEEARESSEATGESENADVFVLVNPTVTRGPEGEPTRAYRVPAGADLQLEVHLRDLRPLSKPSSLSGSEKMAKHKQNSAWFVIVGDADESADELIALRRVRVLLNGRNKLLFELSAPEEAGELFSLSLFLCSDTHVGVDQEATLKLQTY